MGVEPPRSRCRLMVVTPLRRDGTAGGVQPAGGGKEPLQGGGGSSSNELFHMVFVKTKTTLCSRRARDRGSDTEKLCALFWCGCPTVDEELNF